MMRLALLGPANSIHLQRWAAALADRGLAVCVISQHRCERSLLPAAADVVWLPHVGTIGYFGNAPRLRQALSAWRPDLLNVHYASGYGTTATLSGFRPTLLSVWGSDVYDFPYESAFKGWLLRRNLRSATALASTSVAMAAQVRRLTPERNDVAVTPFGVELSVFAPSGGRRVAGRITIGTVKSLAKTYGIDLLLRAFAGLTRDAELRALPFELRLLVVGGGPERERLETLARELGIPRSTEIVGAVAHVDVPLWLNRLDIYCAPSRQESFGVAVIEASACGLPVVVSDVGGLPEVVRDGETGIVVGCEDVAALQAALKRLVLDESLRRSMGLAGRSLVERRFAWDVCVDRMLAAYEAVLAQAPAQKPAKSIRARS